MVALQAENVKVLEDPLKPNTIEFDFLGKDSVQYQKEVNLFAFCPCASSTPCSDSRTVAEACSRSEIRAGIARPAVGV